MGKLRLDKRVALCDNWTRTRIAMHCAITTRRDKILPHCVVATRRDSTTLHGETRARIGREVGRLAIAKSDSLGTRAQIPTGHIVKTLRA